MCGVFYTFQIWNMFPPKHWRYPLYSHTIRWNKALIGWLYSTLPLVLFTAFVVAWYFPPLTPLLGDRGITHHTICLYFVPSYEERQICGHSLTSNGCWPRWLPLRHNPLEIILQRNKLIAIIVPLLAYDVSPPRGYRWLQTRMVHHY